MKLSRRRRQDVRNELLSSYRSGTDFVEQSASLSESHCHHPSAKNIVRAAQRETSLLRASNTLYRLDS